VDSNVWNVFDGHPYGARDAWLGVIGSGCPNDNDGDTVPDTADNCPNVPNPGQDDVDGDGFGDGCEFDSDGDTVPDVQDNCPAVPNSGQEDGDGDGVADACDTVRPAPPIIVSPATGTILTTPRLTVSGSAERLSRVTVFVDSHEYGEAIADPAGFFLLESSVPLSEGPLLITAIAQDAAGNQSLSSDPVAITVDLSAPVAPVIDEPQEGEVLGDPVVVFRGQAEANSTVEVTASSTAVASCRTDAYGVWDCPVSAPLAVGAYSAVATATDAAGRASDPSVARSFVIAVISADHPAESSGSKFEVTNVSAAPNPFDVTVGPTTLSLDAKIDAVSGLAGRSPNHTFNLKAEWVLRDADGVHVRTLAANTAVPPGSRPPGGTIDANVAVTWNATDSLGAQVALEKQYPYAIQIQLVRTYVGPGRGPRCGRGEVPLATPNGACLLDQTNIPVAGSIYPVDRTSPLFGQSPTYSPSGKLVFALPDPPSTLASVDDVLRWVADHTTHLLTVANLTNRSTFVYSMTSHDREADDYLFDHLYDGVSVQGDVLEVIVPNTAYDPLRGIVPAGLAPRPVLVRLDLSRPGAIPSGIPNPVLELAARMEVSPASIGRYIESDHGTGTTFPVYTIPVGGGAYLGVSAGAVTVVDTRAVQNLPPTDLSDPQLVQEAWSHGYPFDSFDSSLNVPLPYTHVYPAEPPVDGSDPGPPTLPANGGGLLPLCDVNPSLPTPNPPRLVDPTPSCTSDSTGAVTGCTGSSIGYGFAATGLDWRAECNFALFGSNLVFPKATCTDPDNHPYVFRPDYFQKRWSALFYPRPGGSQWLVGSPVPASTGDPLNPRGAATLETYAILSNVTNAYRELGLGTPASLRRGLATDPAPLGVCINDVPTGYAYDAGSDAAAPLYDAAHIKSCTTDAECQVCVDYQLDGLNSAYRCAADPRWPPSWMPPCTVDPAHPLDPSPECVSAFCDTVHVKPGHLPSGTGVCTIWGGYGGATYRSGIYWNIGAFYDANGAPRYNAGGRYPQNWLDVFNNVGHEAQHALGGFRAANDPTTAAIDESVGHGLNAKETWAHGADWGFAVYSVLDEARGEFVQRVLNRQRVESWYGGDPNRKGRNQVYGGSCEVDEPDSASLPCDDGADDFVCPGTCTIAATATEPEHTFCTWSAVPPANCAADWDAINANLPSEYNDGMGILEDICGAYSDSVGGFYGMQDGLRAWLFTQATPSTKWVTGQNSFRALIEDADLYGDRRALVSRAFYEHVRRLTVQGTDDVPGIEEFGDILGFPTTREVTRVAMLNAGLQDSDVFTFFAEERAPLGVEVELIDPVGVRVCVDGECAPSDPPPVPSAGDVVVKEVVPTFSGWHTATVLWDRHGSAVGRYRITVGRIASDAPDFRENALPILGDGLGAVSGRVSHDARLPPSEDEDWYRFWYSPLGGVPTGQVRVSLRTVGGAPADSALRGEIMRRDGSGLRAMSVGDNYYAFSAADAGWWYVRVFADRLVSSEEYSVTVYTGVPGTRDLCPGLEYGDAPGPGCWLGGDETSMVVAELTHSHAWSAPAPERSEDVDYYLLCLEQDQGVALLLDDGAHRMRLELHNPVVPSSLTPGTEFPVVGSGGLALTWGYNTVNDWNVPTSGMLIASAEHGNAPGVAGAMMHFVSPVQQCYVLTVRASFGADRVADWETSRSLAEDDELFWSAAQYALFVKKGCVPGSAGCDAIRAVPSIF
jgi:hypothetical protein